MFIGYLYFFNSGSRLLFFLKIVIFIFGGGASIAFVHINYLPTRNQLRTCMFFIIICFNVIFSIFVWNYMRTKHSFCHFYSQHHSLNNLPTPYQGDTCMSEAANLPSNRCSPLFSRGRTSDLWLGRWSHDHPCFPTSSCERRAGPFSVCPRTSAGCGPKLRSKLGSIMQGWRAGGLCCHPSTLFHGREKVTLGLTE